MSDSRGGSNEPSMEEILASIRRIIAEDAEQVEKGTQQESSASAAAETSTETGPETPHEAPVVSDAEHWPEDREAARPQTLHPVPSPEPDDDDDVLELTQLVNEDGSVTDLSEGSGPAMPYVAEEETREESLNRDPEFREEPQEREAQVIEERSSVVQTHHEESPGETVVESETFEDAEVEQDEPTVMATEAESAAGSAAASAEMQTQVESEVRAWLDRNLPEMVERVVREEVERMLRRLKD